MATREENIQKIRTAVYGKDVREAIAEGMEQTYDACEDFADSASASAAAAAAALPIDTTLSVAGKAADAKATGDAVDELKSAIDYGSITVDVKEALLQLAQKVAYIDDQGQTYYDDLYAALYYRYWQVTNTLSHCTSSNGAEQTIKGNPYSATITASAGYTLTGATVSITMGGNDITATAYSNGVISIPAVTGALVISVSAAQAAVSSISAVYTQSGTVYSTDSLDSLKTDLVVTATLEDSSSFIVSSSDYTLSGSLSSASSTITVTFADKTDTVTVTVAVVTLFSGTFLDGVSVSYSSNNLVYWHNSSSTNRVTMCLNGTGDHAVPKGSSAQTTTTIYPIMVPASANKLMATMPRNDLAACIYVNKWNGSEWVNQSVAPGYVFGTQDFDISSVNDGTLGIVITFKNSDNSTAITSEDTTNWKIGWY